MSVRIASLITLAAVASSAIGCSNSMTIERHKEIVADQKEYISTLEQRNQDLESSNQSLLRQDDENKLARTTDELYSQIAKQLEAALKDLRDDDGGEAMTFKNGVWSAGTDLLFDSGSWTISAKGKEVLKKFAEAHRAQNTRYRIVGHTDNAPITRKDTKDRLDTDTNMELSVRRAIAVMGHLKASGISEKAFVECVGMGNSRPIAANDTNATNRKKNRRVEIFVVGTGATAPTSAPKSEKKTK